MLYLQQVQGYSPLHAGLALLPATMALGCAMLTGLAPGTSYLWLAFAFAVLGAGLGLVNPPITETGVAGMPPAQAGVASAVISATRQFGVAESSWPGDAGRLRGRRALLGKTNLPRRRLPWSATRISVSMGSSATCRRARW